MKASENSYIVEWFYLNSLTSFQLHLGEVIYVLFNTRILQVRDMVPLLAQCYFQEQLPVTLSYLQASILLCMGLQLHDVTYIEVRKYETEDQLESLSSNFT